MDWTKDWVITSNDLERMAMKNQQSSFTYQAQAQVLHSEGRFFDSVVMEKKAHHRALQAAYLYKLARRAKGM